MDSLRDFLNENLIQEAEMPKIAPELYEELAGYFRELDVLVRKCDGYMKDYKKYISIAEYKPIHMKILEWCRKYATKLPKIRKGELTKYAGVIILADPKWIDPEHGINFPIYTHHKAIWGKRCYNYHGSTYGNKERQTYMSHIPNEMSLEYDRIGVDRYDMERLNWDKEIFVFDDEAIYLALAPEYWEIEQAIKKEKEAKGQ